MSAAVDDVKHHSVMFMCWPLYRVWLHTYILNLKEGGVKAVFFLLQDHIRKLSDRCHLILRLLAVFLLEIL